MEEPCQTFRQGSLMYVAKRKVMLFLRLLSL